MRTFAQINSSLSALTGVPTTNPAVMQTYTTVQQQLPSDPTLESFSSANQVGIAQLAIQYCNVAVTTTDAAGEAVPRRDVQREHAVRSQAGIDSVTSALAARVLGTGLNSQPAPAP